MKKYLLGLFIVVALIGAGPAPALAEVKLSGFFVAHSQCPAFQSIKKRSNPGNVATEVDRAYKLFAKNKEDASHFLVEVPGASPARRWVSVACGQQVSAADPTTSPPPQHRAGGRSEYVLAVSWQPAFCETRPGKPECRSQTAGRFDAANFTLHGLWPQPRSKAYCNVDSRQVRLDKNGDWQRLDPLDLSAETRTRLNRVMPGTQSGLQRHEWIKHGTCYDGVSAEEYFVDSLLLMAQLNGSAVRDLFAENIGRRISRDAIREAFDAAFGAAASDRIRTACKNDGGRQLITEITIGLSGSIEENSMMGDLILAAPQTDPGCPGGIVDAVGLQ